jgi:hypothetical protein
MSSGRVASGGAGAAARSAGRRVASVRLDPCELDDLAYFSVRMRMRFDPTRLWFWRDAFWATGLTHFNCALRIHGIWGGNCEVPRPRRQLAKLADCLCRYADVIVNFDPHRVRKATKNHLESSNASRFVSHLGSLLLRRPPPGSQDWSGHLTIFCKVGALDRFGKGGITNVWRGTDR